MLLAVNIQVCSTLVSRPTTTHHLRWAGVAARIGRGRGHGRGMGDSPPLRWTACGPVDPWLRTKTTAFAHARVRLDHCVSRGLPDSSLRARPSDPFRSYDHHPLALGFGGLYHASGSPGRAVINILVSSACRPGRRHCHHHSPPAASCGVSGSPSFCQAGSRRW